MKTRLMSVLFVTMYSVPSTFFSFWIKEKSLVISPGEQSSEQFKSYNWTSLKTYTKNGPFSHDCPSSSLDCPLNVIGYFKDQILSQRTKSRYIKSLQENGACGHYSKQ